MSGPWAVQYARARARTRAHPAPACICRDFHCFPLHVLSFHSFFIVFPMFFTPAYKCSPRGIWYPTPPPPGYQSNQALNKLTDSCHAQIATHASSRARPMRRDMFKETLRCEPTIELHIPDAMLEDTGDRFFTRACNLGYMGGGV